MQSNNFRKKILGKAVKIDKSKWNLIDAFQKF